MNGDRCTTAARATEPTAVQGGLFIVDGSVIPGALAVNPTLTFRPKL
jgi:choline dehydrogenase-like flavoprotein